MQKAKVGIVSNALRVNLDAAGAAVPTAEILYFQPRGAVQAIISIMLSPAVAGSSASDNLARCIPGRRCVSARCENTIRNDHVPDTNLNYMVRNHSKVYERCEGQRDRYVSEESAIVCIHTRVCEVQDTLSRPVLGKRRRSINTKGGTDDEGFTSLVE